MGRPKGTHKLTDRECADALVMREIELKEWTAVAERFDCSVPTIKAAMERGRAFLKAWAKDQTTAYIAGVYQVDYQAMAGLVGS